MSDASTQTTAPEAPAQEPQGEQPTKPETDWKAEARKWEQRAKEYKPAADKLAEIEEANKSEAQKAAERIAAAEQKAAAAEARALRREIALEHRLNKDDAALLDGMTDEGAMRQLAERLATAESGRKKQGNHVPREGTPPESPAGDRKREFLRSLTGRD